MKNVIETDLTGKVAVVTGASGTLRSIFAMALARAGAKVALLGRNLSKLNETWQIKSPLRSAPPRVMPVMC